jgi:hypothetical protein
LVQRKAFYAVVLVVVVVAVLALTVLSFQPSNQRTSNTSSLSSNASSSFQVLKTNATVSYDAECLVLENIGHTCPTISQGANGTSASYMRNVELVAFQGADYYAGNFSGGFAVGGPTFPSHNVWFTNSTIICISPSFSNYATCSVNESLPSVSW